MNKLYNRRKIDTHYSSLQKSDYQKVITKKWLQKSDYKKVIKFEFKVLVSKHFILWSILI